MRLAGISISNDDCKTLIDLLHRVGRADDLELARRINRGLEQKTKLLALSPAQRELLLGVLDDAPAKGLTELHGALRKGG